MTEANILLKSLVFALTSGIITKEEYDSAYDALKKAMDIAETWRGGDEVEDVAVSTTLHRHHALWKECEVGGR